jgi:HK97 family phage major capsid protein
MELNQLQEQLNEAVVLMRKNADTYNDQLKKLGSVESLVKEQDDKWQTKIDELQEKIKTQSLELEAKMRRPGLGVDATQDEVKSAHQKAFNAFIRKGHEGDLRAIEQKALSVNSDPDGGYLVTDDMSGRIVTKIFETSPIRQYANIVTISTDAISGPVDINEASVGWVSEEGSRTDTNTPQIGEWRIPVHELYAKPKATQKLLDDVSVNVEAWLANKVADKMARTENNAFVLGDGVGKPRGFLTYTAGTSWQQIQQVISGASAALTSNGLIDLIYSMKAAYRGGAVFGMNRLTQAAVRKLRDDSGASAGTGDYLWQPGLQSGQPSTLLGYPVTEFDDMADVAANSLSVVFGNFKEAYMIVDRIGIRTLRDPYSAKPYVEFYTTKRVGGDVVNFEAVKIQKTASS